jgi:hypothetical protein
VDPICVSTAFELCCKKSVHGVFRYLCAYEAFPKADHVGIVMGPAEPSRSDVMNRDCANASNLVCSDADTEPRPAHSYAKLCLARSDRSSDGSTKFWVINRVRAMGSKIGYQHLLASQILS